MTRELKLQEAPINEAALNGGRAESKTAGAVVIFLGVVREKEGAGTIRALEYEAFEAMAHHQFDLIFNEVEQHWPVESLRVVHRIGEVGAGEPSLWVEVCAGHRGEAFQACQYLIDEMKKRVPIWKKSVEQ